MRYSSYQIHRQCLLDESRQIALDLACPICENSIVSTVPAINGSPQPQIITRYHNEGGFQTNLDILPLIIEEAYLEANPAARPARAFMTMCGEGDVAGIIELLKALEEDADEGDMSPGQLLRWQDPLDGMKTGIHVAIERGQQEVVWLLLWFASGLQTQSFPSEVAQAAEAMGFTRQTANGADIRRLRDEQERTAADVAQSMGNAWTGLLMAGVLQA
jgi:hypothetical protein